MYTYPSEIDLSETTENQSATIPQKRKNPQSTDPSKRKREPRIFQFDSEKKAYYTTSTNTTALYRTAQSVELEKEVRFEQKSRRNYLFSRNENVNNHVEAYKKWETACNSREKGMITASTTVEDVPQLGILTQDLQSTQSSAITPMPEVTYYDARNSEITLLTQANKTLITEKELLEQTVKKLEQENQTLKEKIHTTEQEKERSKEENQTLKQKLEENLEELNRLQSFMDTSNDLKQKNKSLRDSNLKLIEEMGALQTSFNTLRGILQQRLERNLELEKTNQEQVTLIQENKQRITQLETPHAITLQKHIRGFFGKQLSKKCQNISEMKKKTNDLITENKFTELKDIAAALEKENDQAKKLSDNIHKEFQSLVADLSEVSYKK